MSYKDLEKKTDEELIALFRDGDKQVEKELIERYLLCVRQLAAPLFLMGGDKEDLIQEGNVGLYQAMLQYDPKKDTSFATFAKICIRRAQYKAIESSNRKKNAPLNFRISTEVMAEDGDFDKKEAADESLNPEVIFLDKERSDRMMKKIELELSPLEKKVFYRYLAGMDYTEIATEIGKDKKSIDNTIQRIKRKVKAVCLEDY